MPQRRNANLWPRSTPQAAVLRDGQPVRWGSRWPWPIWPSVIGMVLLGLLGVLLSVMFLTELQIAGAVERFVMAAVVLVFPFVTLTWIRWLVRSTTVVIDDDGIDLPVDVLSSERRKIPWGEISSVSVARWVQRWPVVGFPLFIDVDVDAIMPALNLRPEAASPRRVVIHPLACHRTPQGLHRVRRLAAEIARHRNLPFEDATPRT